MRLDRQKCKISKGETGFTLIELMVSTAILSVLMAMLVGYVLAMQNHFFNDIVRTRVNSNLRSAMDIVGMNIRQAGENLQSSFPAITLQTDTDGVGGNLRLRRNLIPEVLTVCSVLSSGSGSVNVSLIGATTPSCIYSNVTSLYNAFNTERLSIDGVRRVYLYNSVTKTGEFVDYTGGSTSSVYQLNISSPSANYPALSSYIYFIEEYAFSLDEETETINLRRDGRIAVPEAVAFSVTAFNINLSMSDGTVLTSLIPSDPLTWKNIENIAITLTGTERRKSRTFSTSITGEFFPRNIISR